MDDRATKKFVRNVKVALAQCDHTLASWARLRGYKKISAWQALHNKRRGKHTRRIRAELCDLAGLKFQTGKSTNHKDTQ